MIPRFIMSSRGESRPLCFGSPTPTLVSAATPWAGIPFEVHELPQLDQPLENSPLAGNRGFMITFEGERHTVVNVRGRDRTLRMSPGLVTFSEGAQAINQLRATGHAKAVVFEVSAPWHQRLISEGGPTTFAELPPIAAHETARALALTVCSEVASGAGSGALFAESVSVALLSYVLERLAPSRMEVHGTLSAGQQRKLARYIDDNLGENLSLQQLAAFTGLRVRQFTSSFRSAFGITPHRYVVQRRLTLGARLLTETKLDIAEIALRAGFSSQSHFATAFRAHFGQSPRRFASARSLELRAVPSAPAHRFGSKR
jgi:AraC-like DNA-binding protein